MNARAAALLALICASLSACSWLPPKPLVACLDPNNMPFSSRSEGGFEVGVAKLLAQELERPLKVRWWAQRRGFVRNNREICDIWPGVPAGLEQLATSRPYYRSSYMFVSREDAGLVDLALDDRRLRRLRLGVQMVGDDGSNTPPAHALARRGMVANIRGFLLYGDYRQPNPPAAIVKAVITREIDAALVWGPLAGWQAKRSSVPLRLEPVTPWLDDAQWPMVFDISVGVRKDDPDLLKGVDRALARRHDDIARLLARYGVPDASAAGT
jgi:mxaJ protein